MPDLDLLVRLFDALPQAAILANRAGLILYVSRRAAEMLNCRPEELTGQQAACLVPERVAQNHVERCRAWFDHPHWLKMGAPNGISVRRRDGTELPVEIVLAPWPLDGEMAALALLRDASDYKRIASSLRESEERYRQLLAAVTDYVYCVKVENGRAVDSEHGPTSVAVTGYQPAEYKADPYLWHRMVHPDDRPAVTQQAMRALAGINVPPLEHRIFHKDGSVRWLRNVIAIRRDQQGNVVGYDGLISDITQRKKLEEEWRKLSSAVEQTDDVVAITDRQGIVEYVNPSFERHTGYPKEEVIGQTLRILKSGQHGPDFYDRLWATVLAGAVFRGEFVNRRRSGEVFIADQSITPMKDATGQVSHLVAVWRDVTERKQLEQAILEISDREQARIGQDLHDGLCQHLVGTAFAVQHLAQRLPARTAQYVAIGVERIGKLIDEAIEQARTMARGLYPVKLESDGFMAALEDLAMRSQQLFKVPCSFECVQTIRVNDNNAAVHLFRIAQEAVTNAAKHAHASRIQIRLVEEDARLTLSVEDDGCGMPEQAGSPTGMGLRIMHYRARMIDGDLQIRSAPEGGTIVRCSWRPN